MKSIKIWSLVAMLFIGMAACTPANSGEDNPNNSPNDNPGGNNGGNNGSNEGVSVEGEWVLTSWNEIEPPFHVYVNFKEDYTFEMYEQVYSLTYEYITGTYDLDDDTLTGEYDGNVHTPGSPWKSSYTVTKTEGEDGTFTLELVDESGVASIYTSTTIPEEVKVEASETRAVAAEHFL